MREPPAAPAAVSTAVADLVLGPAQRGTVLSTTRLAAYVVLDDAAVPRVVALVAPGAVRLPVAACVPRLPALSAGSPALIGDGTIRAGGHAWRPARWWDPVPRIDPRVLRAQGGGLADVVLAEPGEAFGIAIEPAVDAVAALVAGDAGPACRLLGAGPGLTPAGDDVIAGALAALTLVERLPLGAAAAVTDAARSRTTTLSASLLFAAARGQVTPQAAGVLRALGGGGDVTAAAHGLFAIGATSGHDLALGLAAALTFVAPTSAARLRVREAT